MEASRRCTICSGGISRVDWTQDLNTGAVSVRYTVLRRGDHIEFGILRFDNNASLQQSRSLTLPGQQTRVRLVPSAYFTPAQAFVIHKSCYHLLCEFSGSEISPYRAFKLCQAIQPDRERYFGFNTEIDLSNCPDPSALITPQRCLSPSEPTRLLLQPDIAKCGSPLLESLPPEILQMILQYLSPSDLVRFFRISKRALSYANLFCRINPVHFYRCSINTTGTGEDKRILMLALSTWTHLPELDTRWQIVKKVVELAKSLPFVDNDNSVAPTFDPRAPLQPVSHRFGLREDILDIPPHNKTIEVCSIRLEGKHYICGIGFDTGRSKLFLGRETENLNTLNISGITTETIGLAVDALGVRSIKYGTSPWLLGDPESLYCWEGVSVERGCRKIRIVRDALKLRHLSWHQESPYLFEETIVMRNKHPFLYSHGTIAEEYYVRQHPEAERQLVDKFGKIPVETVWFDRDLQAIKMYAGGGLKGISGLSVQTLSKTYYVGACHTTPTSITLQAPHEVLAEIDVRTSELYPLALTASVTPFLVKLQKPYFHHSKV